MQAHALQPEVDVEKEVLDFVASKDSPAEIKETVFSLSPEYSQSLVKSAIRHMIEIGQLELDDEFRLVLKQLEEMDER